MAVATAMAYPPRTNSMTRSATYRAVRLPRGIRGAFTKKVSTKKLICEMPRPKKRGNIARATVRMPGGREGNAEVETHAAINELRDEDQELQRSSDEHADSEGDRGAFEIVPDESRGKENDREIQDHSGGGGNGEVVETVQNAHAERGETQEKQIREDDAVQGDGFVPTVGVVPGEGKGLDDGRERRSFRGR